MSTIDKKFTIVYKTYTNDLKWLEYSLISLKKFLDISNVKEVIIYSHDVCTENVSNIIDNIGFSLFIPCRIIPVHYNIHGYIKQMIVKCLCYKDVNTDYIAIMDCDCLLTTNLNLQTHIRNDGCIEWYYLRKADDPNSVVWKVWKTAFEDSTLTTQNVHYMGNGFPFIFTTKSLANADQYFTSIHGIGYEEWCKNRMKNIKITESVRKLFPILSTIFEEFEYLGFYFHNFSADYKFVASNEPRSRKSNILQNWSHGGITEEIKSTIEQILR
jgi:hypothetical protein